MKVTAPLFSLDASGSLGGAIVASKWKGRNYMRRLVTPSNPRSGGQTSNRALMRFLSQYWANLSPLAQAEWDALAAQGNYSTFNAYVAYNMSRWTQLLYPVIDLPVVVQAFAGTITSITGTGGVGQITGVLDPAVAGANPFGAVIAMNADNNSTYAKEDVKLFVPNNGVDNTDFVISNIEPGQYYLKARRFDEMGNLGAAVQSAQITVT